MVCQLEKTILYKIVPMCSYGGGTLHIPDLQYHHFGSHCILKYNIVTALW
jgi:hypothetical protein